MAQKMDCEKSHLRLLKRIYFLAIFMPLFSSPWWNVNFRPESHLVSTINIDGPHPVAVLQTERGQCCAVPCGLLLFDSGNEWGLFVCLSVCLSVSL